MEVLSKTEARALLAIVKFNPITCANLGDALWGNWRGPSNCSCPFARPAGAIVKRLRALGFVTRHYIASDPRTLYTATPRGEQHLRTNQATRIAAGLQPVVSSTNKKKDQS